MKIFVAQIPPEGVSFSEEIPAEKLELDSELFKFPEPVRVRAQITKITNAVTCDLDLEGTMRCSCSRCLGEFVLPLRKHLQFNYPVDRTVTAIDIDPDIREEIILGLPVRLLCAPDCRGLCPECGQNLNAGQCSCKN